MQVWDITLGTESGPEKLLGESVAWPEYGVTFSIYVCDVYDGESFLASLIVLRELFFLWQ